MIYLEDYIELIEELPDLIRDQSEELRCLDLELTPEFEKLETDANTLFQQKSNGQITPEIFKQKWHVIKKGYRKMQTRSQQKIEITANMENMMDRYLKKLEDEIAKFRRDLDVDNSESSARLMEKTLHDIKVQKNAREAERNHLEDAVKAEQDAKDKHEKEQLEVALANFQQQKLELESRNENKPTVSTENIDKSDPNKKELSLEMLLYVSRVPRDHHKHADKDFNDLDDSTGSISGAFPSDEEIINAAKVAVLLPYLQENERNNLAQMITQNSLVPLSAWHPESVMNGKKVLENYLVHISNPIKNGFKGPGRPKKEQQESVDYVEILPEFREKVKNAHGIIHKVYSEQCHALDLVVKEQITTFLTNSNIFNAAKKHAQSSSKSSSAKNVHSATRPLHVEVSRKTATTPKINGSHGGESNSTSIRRNDSSSVSAPAQIEWIDESDPKMNDEKPYCLCKNISYGNMIRCDNVQCKKGEWFHYTCVGITVEPSGNWYCPECRNLNENNRSPIANKHVRTKRFSPTLQTKVNTDSLPLLSTSTKLGQINSKHSKKIKLDLSS